MQETKHGCIPLPAGRVPIQVVGIRADERQHCGQGSPRLLATMQQDRADVYVRSAVPNPAANSFTIHLSKAVSVSTSVAWFVVNQGRWERRATCLIWRSSYAT